MAQNLQQLKRRIRTAKNISQIAKAMEMISASKIKRAQTTAENSKPYANRVIRLTDAIMKNADFKNYHHAYIDGNNSEKKLYIIISPDRGMIGALNTELFKKILDINITQEDFVATVGVKAERFAAKVNYNLVASFPMGTSIPQYSFVYRLVRIINEYYTAHKVGSVHLIFTDFVSFFSQVPVLHDILPIKAFITDEENEKPAQELPYLFEPGIPKILDALLPHYVEVRIFNALIQAFTSEQAARMIAMQNAKNNAIDIANYYTLAYNKSRQERITNEILDIGNAAMSTSA